MLSDFVPNISRHFLYSILEHDYDNGVEIINTVIRFSPEQIGEFLSSCAGSLEGIFCRFEVDLREYRGIKEGIISELKNPGEETSEEFN